MAILGNQNLDWMDIQYSNSEEEINGDTLQVVEEDISTFTEPFIPNDRVPFSTHPHMDVEREVGRVFGILGHHINKLNIAKSAKRPAAKKYRELKNLITELTRDAKAAGIKVELEYPEEVIEDETNITESLVDSQAILPLVQELILGLSMSHEERLEHYGTHGLLLIAKRVEQLLNT